MLKLQKRLMPKTYFYFAHLIDGIDENISWLGAFIRTLVPLLLGVVTGILAIEFKTSQYPVYYGLMAAFLSIFLIVWPDILHPELISPTYANKKGKLYALYLILILAFSSLGAFGAQISNSIYLHNRELYSFIDLRGIVTNLISAMIWAAIAAFVVRSQARKFQSNPSKSDQTGTANLDADAK